MSLAAMPAARRHPGPRRVWSHSDMLLPALLLAAAALAARADGGAGSALRTRPSLRRRSAEETTAEDVLAEVLRADLRRDNDDYADARRLSAYVQPAKSFVPKSKYVRPIQNEFEYSGLQRRSANDNITGEQEEKPIGREAQKNVEGQQIREKVEDVGSEGEKRQKVREKNEERHRGQKIEHLGRKMNQGGEEVSSQIPKPTTLRAALLPSPRPGENASNAKKRYEVRARTADPQLQHFKSESESIEKFNSLSSVQAAEPAGERSAASTRRTMRQAVSSVRPAGGTVMRAARDVREPTQRRARSRARDARRVKDAQERRKLRKVRAAREAREKQSRIKQPHLRQGPDVAHARAHVRAAPRSQQLHVDAALKRLREHMRAGKPLPAQRKLPLQLLDMAAARGPVVAARRLRNKLCDRHFLRPEGPKYDSLGKIYSEKFKARGRGNYGFDQTRAPRLVLPRCCNCCRKSVLGCE